MFPKPTTILLVLCAIASVTAQPKPKSFYLSLTPEALFAHGLTKNVGGCSISLNTGTSYCDLYVTTATTGSGGYRGWPRNGNDQGTGCVKAPQFPKGRTYCWYQGSEYNNHPLSVRNTFCTSSGLTNAANQLRYAISEDQCGLP